MSPSSPLSEGGEEAGQGFEEVGGEGFADLLVFGDFACDAMLHEMVQPGHLHDLCLRNQPADHFKVVRRHLRVAQAVDGEYGAFDFAQPFGGIYGEEGVEPGRTTRVFDRGHYCGRNG